MPPITRPLPGSVSSSAVSEPKTGHASSTTWALEMARLGTPPIPAALVRAARSAVPAGRPERSRARQTPVVVRGPTRRAPASPTPGHGGCGDWSCLDDRLKVAEAVRASVAGGRLFDSGRSVAYVLRFGGRVRTTPCSSDTWMVPPSPKERPPSVTGRHPPPTAPAAVTGPRSRSNCLRTARARAFARTDVHGWLEVGPVPSAGQRVTCGLGAGRLR